MSEIVEEIRRAYARVGITLGAPSAYGTYYRLACAGCGRMLGNVGDKLLPGMAETIVAAQLDLYAAGLLGCACGHQRERVRNLDPEHGRARPPRLGDGDGKHGRDDRPLAPLA